MKAWLSILILIATCSAKAELQSSHMRGFTVQDCDKNESCFRASGDLAFISSDGAGLSASQVKLEIRRPHRQKPEHLTCADFRFDLRTNYLICNNSEVKNAKSVLIDRDHRISEIAARN